MSKQNQAIELAGRSPEIAKEIENVLIQGDLSRLTPEQCVEYYMATCKSLGLNPLTSPFQYLILNGKKVLYASKSCTEQLRKINGISITDLTESLQEGVFIVKVKGNDKTGRTDASSGAVAVTGLRGDPLANAMMKAETKAKRRFTLSISGLGMLDESEIDSIPGATVQPINVQSLPKQATETKEDAAKPAPAVQQNAPVSQPKPGSAVGHSTAKTAAQPRAVAQPTAQAKTVAKPAPAKAPPAQPAPAAKEQPKGPAPLAVPVQQPLAPAAPASEPKKPGTRTKKMMDIATATKTSTTNILECIARNLGCTKDNLQQRTGAQIDGVISSIEGIMGQFDGKLVRAFVCGEADIDARLAKAYTDLYIASQK